MTWFGKHRTYGTYANLSSLMPEKNFCKYEDWDVGKTKNGELKYYIYWRKILINVIFYPKGRLYITYGSKVIKNQLRHNNTMTDDLFSQVTDLILNFEKPIDIMITKEQEEYNKLSKEFDKFLGLTN